jgi:hypothetical protein
MPPRFLQASKKEIGPAQQENLRQGCIPAGQRRQVLINHCFEQRSDDLFDGHAGLEQRIGIRLSEDAALAADFMQRVSLITHFREPLERDLQFARGLFDERARAARTGALH